MHDACNRSYLESRQYFLHFGGQEEKMKYLPCMFVNFVEYVLLDQVQRKYRH